MRLRHDRLGSNSAIRRYAGLVREASESGPSNEFEPQLVVEVEFTTWTSDGILWHPSFQGVRKGEPAKWVTVVGA